MKPSDLPRKLPHDGKGYRKQIRMHLNFGRAGGAATYTIHGPKGEKLPIEYQYDTRDKSGESTGFFIEGVKEGNNLNALDRRFPTWAAVVAYWPVYLKSKGEQP